MKNQLSNITLFSIVWGLFNLVSCTTTSATSNTIVETTDQISIVKSDLRILHINDHHSHLEANKSTITLDGKPTIVKSGGFPQLVQAYKQLEANNNYTLKLHAGDASTGSIYFSVFKGQADVEQMNHICFDAMAIGNHEFDNGDLGLKDFVDKLHNHPTCKTPVISANVQFKVGKSPLARKSQSDYIQPYIIKTVNGHKVAIIGLTVGDKTKNSSRPDESTSFNDEIKTTQKFIDELSKKENISRFVILSHYGYKNDLNLASKVKGVDIIVGGDSHTLLGSKLSQYGLNPQGEYPTIIKNADNQNVCVVQSSEYANILGELNVWFDEKGNVKECKGTPHYIISNHFERMIDKKAEPLNEEDKNAVLKDIAQSNGDIMLTKADDEAQKSLDGFSTQLGKLTKQVIGKSKEILCLERVPGQGKSKSKECKELTKQHGSDISQVVAKSYLLSSKKADFCIINAGGVRVDVPQGDYTIEDAYTLLPFANVLMELTLTGKQILEVIEETLIYSQDSDGAYPYAAGIRWQADLNQAKGSIIKKLEINPKMKGKWKSIDPNKKYIIITSDYLAQGKDGYTVFGNKDIARVDVGTDYALAFIDYVKKLTSHKKELQKLPKEEYSTQLLIKKK